jgi:C4-dicarboxylate-binding protein DctP
MLRNALRCLKLSMLAAGVLAVGLAGATEAAQRLRISLDTNPTHVRNKGVELFVAALKKRVGDAIEVEVFPSAQLYRDRDVGRALRQGSVEMAIPGTWVLDGIVPAMAITSLPVFYGLPEETAIELMDGELGQAINASAEERLRVKVLGPWMNLGFSHFYSTRKPLNKHEDLAGLRIRVQGGTANAKRVEGLGGIPNLIAWPDVPLALSTDVVDAVSSTHESIASAKLWDSGLRYCFEDNQWFGQYVPLVSRSFWDNLSPEHRQATTEAWAEVIGQAREMAAEAQRKARQTLRENGITIVTASQEDLARVRGELMKLQDEIVAEMKIEPELVAKAVAEVCARGLLK